MARVALNYHGWSGIWKIAVSDQIPAPCLIGLDLSKHVQIDCLHGNPLSGEADCSHCGKHGNPKH